MEKVSVVIPTFNRSISLQRAINSVFKQTYQNYELIIVDDNSNDDTWEKIKKIKDNRIRYYHNEKNLGGSCCRNIGIGLSNSKYIAFLDDDDEWFPTKLEKQMSIIQTTNSDYCGVHTGFSFIKGIKFIKDQIPQKEGDLFIDLLCSNCIGTTSTFLVKKSCLLDTGNFDEKLPAAQDWDLYIRLAKKYKFKRISESLVNYYIHDKEQITDDYKKKLNSYEYIYKKNKNEIMKYNKLHAKHLFILSTLELLNGNKVNAFNYIKKSTILAPFNLKYWGLLISIKFYPNLYFQLRKIVNKNNIFKK
jgi:glycosyltransferase involved in cell wall biosynthesis